MTRRESLDADFDAFQALLETAPLHLRQLAAAEMAEGKVESTRTYLRALGQLLEALLCQLNAMVDGALLVFASQAKGTAISKPYLDSNRDTLLSDIEAATTVDRKGLVGWEQVELTRTQCNAGKHRLGIEFERDTTTALELKALVEPTEATLRERLDGVRDWLRALDKSFSPTAS